MDAKNIGIVTQFLAKIDTENQEPRTGAAEYENHRANTGNNVPRQLMRYVREKKREKGKKKKCLA